MDQMNARQNADNLLQSHLRVESLHTGDSMRVPFAKVHWHFATDKHLHATFLRADPRQAVAMALLYDPTAQRESLLVRVERVVGSNEAAQAEAFHLRLVYRSATCLTVAVYAPAPESSVGEMVAVLDCFWWDQFWLQAAVVVMDARRLSHAQAAHLLCWTLENLSVSTSKEDAEIWEDSGTINDYRFDMSLGN